jgi:putative toxin-antitoxin system antitoxin component (TIGR02293 family)
MNAKTASGRREQRRMSSVAAIANGQIPETNSATAQDVIALIRKGLPVRELAALQHSLDVPIEKLAPKLGISPATLQRRKLEGRLHQDESDRVFRYARLFGRAVQVLESKESARRWLNSPQVGLGGAVPLDYAETEVGAREVEDLLGRIEFGVYS